MNRRSVTLQGAAVMDHAKGHLRHRYAWIVGLVLVLWLPAACTGGPAPVLPVVPTSTGTAGLTVTDVSPTLDTFRYVAGSIQSPAGRTLSLAASADGQRLYAGTYSGVWRSDNAGATWRQMSRPQPAPGSTTVPDALYAPVVWDIAINPDHQDIVFVAANGDTRVAARQQNGVYRSTDGGQTWAPVHPSPCGPGGQVGQLAIAPDNSQLIYSADGCGLGISTDGGSTWRMKTLGGNVWHVAVARHQGTARKVYAAGDGQVYYSTDAGETWTTDPGAALVRATVGSFAGTPSSCCFGGGNNAAQVLAIEPRNPDVVYLATIGQANGPSFYQPASGGPNGTLCNYAYKPPQVLRGCGEGSLWIGYFTNFSAGQRAQWGQMAGPSVYYGVTTTSGNVYVMTKETPNGFLLFFADESHVFVSVGRPNTAAGWHRLDGRDISQSYLDNDYTNSNGSNKVFMHADPHALAVSANFNLTLRTPYGVPYPYSENNVLNQFLGGTIWLANDGGVARSTDGGVTWALGNGMTTLQPVNIAGVAVANRPPALYMGTGDNDDFYTLNAGTNWADALSSCGDCDAWFGDPAQPTRVLSLVPRAGGLNLYNVGFASSPPSNPLPNAGDLAQLRGIPSPAGWTNATSTYVAQGYRPIVQTLAGETPLQDGDYVLIRSGVGSARVLVRTTSISSITSAAVWQNATIAPQIGPVLPANTIDVVQVAGGHTSPVFYVGDPGGSQQVWKWTTGMSSWQLIVGAGRSETAAQRFLVDPYDSRVVYIVTTNGLKRSDDGGATWSPETSLSTAATESGAYPVNVAVRDIIFDRAEPGTRFALGDAGVYITLDGRNWARLLSTTALPGRPVALYFDPISNPQDRALYVAMNGRGVVRISPVPAPRTP
jgi:BNR/Asp-box repeat protein